MIFGSVLLSTLMASLCFAVLPPTNPPWPPTFNMSLSTLTMQCNSSGWSSPERGAAFGIVSYDWSNAKAQWAAQKPMDCEERLVAQATMTKTVNPAAKVFVYRNIVKALPWFTAVREKLDDPQYSSWFLRFDGARLRQHNLHVPSCAAENSTKCSVFYHDQEQTPAVPTPQLPHPDGVCTDDVFETSKVLSQTKVMTVLTLSSSPRQEGQPCGEYLFDHRNGSMLRDWLLDEIISSDISGLGNANIDGFFIDDYWCSNLICKSDPSVAGCPCNDPEQGPTEIDKYSQVDMGLSDEEIADITRAWNETMGAVQERILEQGTP
eukprot:jgi/Bigna1/78316/fgenesh1_pg.54_\